MNEVSIRLKMKVLPPALRQCPHQVRLVHEAIADTDRIKALADPVDLEALFVEDVRDIPVSTCIMTTRWCNAL